MTRPIRPGYLLNKFPAAAPSGGPGVGVDNLLLGDGSSNFLLGDGSSVILLV